MYEYMRVCESLMFDLEKGIYKQDQKIPTEREMCERFGVSISTVRKSMYYLRDKGLIYAKRGSGYYVARKQEQFSKLERPSLSMLGTDLKVTTELVSFIIRRCGIVEAKELKVKVNSLIYEVVRKRLVEECLSTIEYCIIPVKNVPDLLEEDAQVSLNRAYQANGIDRVKVTNCLKVFDEETLSLYKGMEIDIEGVNFNLERRLERLDGEVIELAKVLIFDQQLSYEYIHLY